MNSSHFPVIYWAPLASVWLALGALAALSGDPYLAAATVAALGLLILSVRLEVIQRRRWANLAATVAHLEARTRRTLNDRY